MRAAAGVAAAEGLRGSRLARRRPRDEEPPPHTRSSDGCQHLPVADSDLVKSIGDIGTGQNQGLSPSSTDPGGRLPGPIRAARAPVCLE